MTSTFGINIINVYMERNCLGKGGRGPCHHVEADVVDVVIARFEHTIAVSQQTLLSSFHQIFY